MELVNPLRDITSRKQGDLASRGRHPDLPPTHNTWPWDASRKGLRETWREALSASQPAGSQSHRRSQGGSWYKHDPRRAGKAHGKRKCDCTLPFSPSRLSWESTLVPTRSHPGNGRRGKRYTEPSVIPGLFPRELEMSRPSSLRVQHHAPHCPAFGHAAEI